MARLRNGKSPTRPDRQHDSMKSFPGSRQISVLVFFGALLRAPSLEAQGCNVTADPFWKDTIEFPADPFSVNPFPNPRWVKFTILTCDPTRVYFQNSNEFAFHYDFATARLDPFVGVSREDFDAATLFTAGQEAILGAVVLPPSLIMSPFAFGIQFVGKDPYPPATVVELFQTVAANVVHQGAQAYYFPTFEQLPTAQANAAFLETNGVLLGSADRWADGNAIYAQGWALGTLKFVAASEIDTAYNAGTLGPDDVLLTDGVPAELPFVAGILSLAPATPNSHVAILARNYGVPFIYLSRPEDATRAPGLDGRTVIVSAFQNFVGDSFRLFDIEGQLDSETIAEILALKELPPLELTPLRMAPSYSVAVADLSPADVDIVGGKAANYSLLLEAIPANTRVATAFTFNLWTDFLSQTIGNGNTLRQEIDARLALYTSYPPADFAAVATALQGVRDLIEDPLGPIFSSALRDAVITTLEDPRYGFDLAKKIRLRSSTNFEDSDQFTGAGLFDSRSGCLLDDLDGDELGPSHCDATKATERGIFRAIRRVFASLYNDNAYLERLRWGVEENTVGMALLVHHSFPDETELANGVATLTPLGPNYNIEMVTQVGATSVSNPGDGSVPETVSVFAFGSGGRFPEMVQESNLLPLGSRVLEWEKEYQDFASLFIAVAEAFAAATGKQQYTLDLEYKKIAPGDQLIVKQVREIPQPDSERSITPFLISVPTTFTTFQGEAGDIYSNHRLKSSWTFETQNMWLTEGNLQSGAFLRLTAEFTDGCSIYHFDGAASALPQAEQPYRADRFARLGWTFGHLPNPRTYELSAGPFPALVSRSESPFFTLEDLGFWAQVDYARPVLGWDGFSPEPGPTTQEFIYLVAERLPREGDLEQFRSVTQDGVTVTIRYYWPPEPRGIVAGYTAPLVGWIETVIEGLTAEPMVLTGDRSQTYRPEHHNFAEHFMFAPHEEEGIAEGVLAELDAQRIRWIHVLVGGLNDPVVLFSACELALECACRSVDTPFSRGDCNGDTTEDLSDAIYHLSILFTGELPSACPEACDANGDAESDLSDAVYLLVYLFTGGPPPSAPFPDCELDPEPGNSLGCYAFACVGD